MRLLQRGLHSPRKQSHFISGYLEICGPVLVFARSMEGIDFE